MSALVGLVGAHPEGMAALQRLNAQLRDLG